MLELIDTDHSTMSITLRNPAAVSAEQFGRQGYISPLSLFDGEGARAVQREFARLEEEVGRETCRIGLLDRHHDQEFIWRIAADSRVLDLVQAVAGPSFYLLATHFFCKYPVEPQGTRHFVAWHQDVTYWGLSLPSAVTVWYAVDDSDIDNGCMRVIPGTHHTIRDHGVADEEGNLLRSNQEIALTPGEEALAVDLELKAGQASLHHGLLIHGSRPNLSQRRRCGLTLRYVPAGVRQVADSNTGRRWRPVLVRGSDPHDWPDAVQAPFDFP